MAGYCTSVRPYLEEPQPSENTVQAVSIVGWNSSIITISTVANTSPTLIAVQFVPNT